MATTGSVRIGDVGTQYKARIQDAGAPVDLSSATVGTLWFKPPLGAAFSRVAEISNDGDDWFLTYTLLEGTDDTFHARAGLWRWQGYLEFADGQRYHTSIDTYVVSTNLDS